MKLTKETIWHFTCDFCKLWWSFASSDEYQPKKKIFCPHQMNFPYSNSPSSMALVAASIARASLSAIFRMWVGVEARGMGTSSGTPKIL